MVGCLSKYMIKISLFLSVVSIYLNIFKSFIVGSPWNIIKTESFSIYKTNYYYDNEQKCSNHYITEYDALAFGHKGVAINIPQRTNTTNPQISRSTLLRYPDRQPRVR